MSTSVMVLNKYYQPVARWSIERAITSIYLGKAEIVKFTEGKVIRSVKEEFAIPEVIRLVRATYAKLFQQGFSRKGVFKRDHYTCQYCGDQDRDNLTLDHIHPKSRGGEDSWDNCTTACVKCNNRKGNKTPEEMGWKRPKTGPYLFFDMEFFSF